MKTVIIDKAGTEHELEAVILGIVTDLHKLNQRLIFVESQLGISYEQPVEEVSVEEAPVEETPAEEPVTE
jgi:hypothetical protein